jgi:sec-independent protein translocase protein TatA
MGSLGISELLVILAILLVIFGGKRLPDIARGLGSAIRNFKEGVTGKNDVNNQDKS